MKKQLIIYIDGKYIKTEAKVLEGFTPGVFKAKGVFETMLGVGQMVFDVEEHLQRLRSAFQGVEMSREIIHKVVKDNGFDVCRVRVLAWVEGGQKHTTVMVLKYIPSQKEIFKVCLIKTNRSANNRLANIKSLDYQIFAAAYAKAYAKGFDDALLINRKGYVFESSRANVFIFKEGRLITPPLSSGCLNGITRQKVIRIAKGFGIPVLEKNLTPAMIKSASGAFLTNSLWGCKCFQL